MKARLILFGVLGAIVLTGLWFFLLWKPQTSKLDDAKAEKVAAEQKESELTARLNRLKTLEANAAVLERDRALLSTAMPSTDQLDQFILQVNERATKAGVQFVSVAPSQPAAGAAAPGVAAAGPLNVGLGINVTGDYFAILRFMEELRDGPRLVTVDSFSLSGTGNQMSAAINGRMFVSPQVAVAAATPSG